MSARTPPLPSDTLDDELTQAITQVEQSSPIATAQSSRYRYLKNHETIIQTIVRGIHRDTITTIVDIAEKAGVYAWGAISIKNICYLFLFWLLTGKSYRELESESGYPRSNYKQSFGALRNSIQDWAELNVHVMRRYGSLGRARQDAISQAIVDERKATARAVITDTSLQQLTLMLDGKIFKLVGGRKNETTTKEFKNENWSAYKLKQKRGTNVQFLCDNNQVFTYVSDCYPGSFHDMRCIKDCIESIKFHTILHGDVVVADAGYQGLSKYIKCKVIKKKPKGRKLTQEEEDRNTDLSSVRSKIERAFGNLVHKFKILDLKNGFDGRPEKFNEILFICVAIWNIDRRRSLGITLPPLPDS